VGHKLIQVPPVISLSKRKGKEEPIQVPEPRVEIIFAIACVLVNSEDGP